MNEKHRIVAPSRILLVIALAVPMLVCAGVATYVQAQAYCPNTKEDWGLCPATSNACPILQCTGEYRRRQLNDWFYLHSPGDQAWNPEELGICIKYGPCILVGDVCKEDQQNVYYEYALLVTSGPCVP